MKIKLKEILITLIIGLLVVVTSAMLVFSLIVLGFLYNEPIYLIVISLVLILLSYRIGKEIWSKDNTSSGDQKS